jgi:riboflavin synthase
MFTGIVTAVGEVRSISIAEDGGGRELTIRAPWRGVALGESIAVSGACLTVASRGRGWFGVRAVGPTLERTRLGELRRGDKVNLERALRAGDRLGGHFVQGHVDGVGAVVRVRADRDAHLVDIRVPEPVARATIPLGAIAVDGVSLTVNAMPGDGIIQVSLVPFTLAHTTLGALAVGDRVHLEADMIGKYVRSFLQKGVAKRE